MIVLEEDKCNLIRTTAMFCMLVRIINCKEMECRANRAISGWLKRYWGWSGLQAQGQQYHAALHNKKTRVKKGKHHTGIDQ